MQIHRSTFVLLSLILGSASAVAMGCSETSIDVGERSEDDAGLPRSFIPESDGGDGSAVPNDRLLLCMGTACPFPWATCASRTPDEVVYKCQHNLLTDNENCGECGNECPLFDVLGMRSRCVDGQCTAECVDEVHVDCNGRLEDGCETNIASDTENCGACGNACAPGEPCFDGKCGCPGGTELCNGQCVNTSSSNAHCGACDNACPQPDGGPPPPHSEYRCVAGQCNRLACIDEHTVKWEDCNGDLYEPNSDGCEVDVGSTARDPNNCGGCNVVCGPEQTCSEINGHVACICEPNETRCEKFGLVECADLQNDPEHCGACGYFCPAIGGQHQVTGCRKGMCTYECEPGWADCNDNPLDGCETNLMTHGANCGACGKKCDSASGQPCIDGKCFEVECDGGGPR